MSATVPDMDIKEVEKQVTKALNADRHAVAIIRQMRECAKFAIGDYINEYYQYRADSDKSYTEAIAGVKARFRVCHRTDEGFTFAARVCQNGKLGKLFCLETKSRAYELDTHYSNAVILGEDFIADDQIKEMKRIRKIAQDYNKTIAASFESYDGMKEWIKTNLKPGVELWVCYPGQEDNLDKTCRYVAQEVKTRTLNSSDWYDEAILKTQQKSLAKTFAKTEGYMLKLTCTNWNGTTEDRWQADTRWTHNANCSYYRFYLEKPRSWSKGDQL